MSVTPSQTVGPYFHIGLIDERFRFTQLCQGEGERLVIEGTVFDADGKSIIDAMLEIWQPDRKAFGRFGTHPEAGTFTFDVMRPKALDAMQAPHLCVGVFARGLLKRLYSRIYFDGEPANATDPVLALVPAARRATLVAVATAPGRYRFDLHLSGPDETVFLEC